MSGGERGNKTQRNVKTDESVEDDDKCALQIKEEGYLFVDLNGECVDTKDTVFCPFGQWIVPDVFGDGKSECSSFLLSCGGISRNQNYLKTFQCGETSQYL